MPKEQSDDPYLNNVERLEPQIWNGWTASCSPAEISMAISLKRIADALEGVGNSDLEGVAYRAGVAFKNGMNAA